MDPNINIPLWITIIGNFGFPIAITLYLFIRFERKIEKLELDIHNLIHMIELWKRE